MNRAALRWSVDVELSFAQSIYVVALGERSVEPTLRSMLKGTVQTVNDRLLTHSLECGRFWEGLRSSAQGGKTVLASIPESLRGAGCSELMLESVERQVASLLTGGRHDFDQAFPQLAAQIELRFRPLRDRWETCGFGLLHMLTKGFWGGSVLTVQDAQPSIPLVMIQPVRGGDGGADPQTGRVWMEAMLTDVDPAVPEVLRLAFLIHLLRVSQALDFDDLSPEMRKVYRLALMTQCLEVGREFDLVRDAELPVERAIELWRLGDSLLVGTVLNWWEAESDAEDPWPIKVQRLSAALATE